MQAVGKLLRQHPIELGLLAVTTFVLLRAHHLEVAPPSSLLWMPLVVALTFVLGNSAEKWLKRVYWIVWLVILPLWIYTPDAFWRTGAGVIAGLVLPLLIVLVGRWAQENKRFANDLIVYLRAGFLALLFVNVAYGLLLAILYSTAYIFGFEGEWLETTAVWCAIIGNILLVPAGFMLLCDEQGAREFGGSKISDRLLAYVVMPALLVYMGVFALYMVKILATWSLPRGGVAYMVFGLTLVAFALKALHPLYAEQKFRYNWFFNQFSLYLLPYVVLFWVGALRRISEYGLTEPRIYLLLCGAIMSIGVLLFLSRRSGSFLTLCVAALSLFYLTTFIPTFNPRRIALHAQIQRAERLAGALNLLRADGTIALDPRLSRDSLYQQLYESVRYISADSVVMARFGIDSPDELVARSIEIKGTQAPIEISDNYHKLYLHNDLYCTFANDTLRFRLGAGTAEIRLAASDLLESQLAAAGIDLDRLDQITPEQSNQLLDYRCEEYRILFSQINMDPKAGTITNAYLRAVFTR